jgi:hypothetical protein
MSVIHTAFDPANIRFSNLDKTRKGGKIVYVSLGDDRRTRVIVQTPNVSLPFGITPYTEASTGEVQSYSIDMSFRGHDTDPKIAEFMGKMRALDDILITKGVDNSNAYFGKTMSRDLVVEFYRKLVKDPNNPQYAPTMKCKVPIMNGEPTTLFFDETRAPTTIDAIGKGCTVRMILELSSLWFVNKNYGVTWKVVQCLVTSRPKRMDTYAFIDDGDVTPASGAALGGAHNDDDDNDQVEDDEFDV